MIRVVGTCRHKVLSVPHILLIGSPYPGAVFLRRGISRSHCLQSSSKISEWGAVSECKSQGGPTRVFVIHRVVGIVYLLQEQVAEAGDEPGGASCTLDIT